MIIAPFANHDSELSPKNVIKSVSQSTSNEKLDGGAIFYFSGYCSKQAHTTSIGIINTFFESKAHGECSTKAKNTSFFAIICSIST